MFYHIFPTHSILEVLDEVSRSAEWFPDIQIRWPARFLGPSSENTVKVICFCPSSENAGNVSFVLSENIVNVAFCFAQAPKTQETYSGFGPSSETHSYRSVLFWPKLRNHSKRNGVFIPSSENTVNVTFCLPKLRKHIKRNVLLSQALKTQ